MDKIEAEITNDVTRIPNVIREAAAVATSASVRLHRLTPPKKIEPQVQRYLRYLDQSITAIREAADLFAAGEKSKGLAKLDFVDKIDEKSGAAAFALKLLRCQRTD